MILGVVTGLMVLRRRIEDRGRFALSWVGLLGLLAVLGQLTSTALA